MASRRTKIIFASAILALGAGYGFYMSAQAVPPTLAQAPMNITNVIPPAFVMAVDDSGSMTFETLFPGQDGQGCWNTGSTNPFFNTNGTMRTTGNCGFNHIIPFPGHRIDANRRAIPPLDIYGFARSPSYNPAYFDPRTVYSPWKRYDNTDYPQASITATLSNPRVTTSPQFNMTVNHRDRVDDVDPGYIETADQTYNNGTIFPAGVTYRRALACGGLPGTLGLWSTLATTVTLSANCTNIGVRRDQASQPAADELFVFPSGTVLPAGTVYYNLADAACGGLSTGLPTQRNWVTLTAAHTLTATCTLGVEYFPARYYLPVADAPPGGFIATSRVLATNAGGPGVDLYRYEIKPANYGTTAQYLAAIQNFANWFSYYGNRNRAMISGMTRSLVEVNNMSIGYFTINQNGSRDNPLTVPAERATMYDMSDNSVGGARAQLFTNMIALPASGSTPNRQAVNAIGQQFLRTDAGAPIKLACQKNAGMLFTDGYSNQDGPAVTNANGDGPMGTPFRDNFDNTMADIAASYYRTNLRSDLTAGLVPVSNACPAGGGNASDLSIDCIRNPHMNFYGVTLGARGNLFNPDIAQDAYTDAAVYNNWPSRQNDNPSTVDDIWHATVNTRGEYVNAETPSAIIEAMRRILASVSEGASPAGTIGQTGARIGASSLSVQPRYESTNNGTDWYGTLSADSVTADAITGAATFAPAWEASAKLAVQPSRTIRFGQTGSSVVPNVRDFSAANVSLTALCNGVLSRCTPADITALGAGMTNVQAVAYLRGARTLETSGILRTRTTLLGDIINSSPVVSAPNDDYGYGSLGGTLASTYATYLTAKKAANRPMVYVGANDGMIHAFDGRTTATGGNETYAYIPATALGHMGNLLFPYNEDDAGDQKFQHRYYVDGPVTVSDVNIGGAWKTVLVGTTGAGGRSVFALDVTNPDAITVLWEINNLITANTAISANIGNVLGKPVIVPVKDGSGTVTWKAIFGNGYNSTNLQARLFVVNIGTGAVTSIAAAESVTPALPYNGLGNIVAIDRQRQLGASWVDGRDGYADTVYGADQNGAIWKFDLQTNTVALGGTPLFVAKDASNNRQPILGGLTAATGPGGGVMIYFGTGSFSFSGDPGNNSIQTLYAVLDRNTSVTGRSELLAQTVGTDTGGFRGTSSNQMTIGRKGWYIDLPTGERFVGYPRIESGIIFLPTFQPSGVNANDCGVSGTNWLYGLSSLSGAAAFGQVNVGSPNGASPGGSTGAVALNTGGTAPVKDVTVMTSPRIQPIEAAPVAGSPSLGDANGDGVLDDDDGDGIPDIYEAKCSMVIRVAGADPLYIPRPCGRQSWRQVR